MRIQHKRLVSKSLLVALAAGALFANACSTDDDSGNNNGGTGGSRAGSGGKGNTGGKGGTGGASGKGGGIGISGSAGAEDAGTGGLSGAGGSEEAGSSGEGGGAGAPAAAVENYTATLSGAEEVPPVATTATGAATFTYDPNTRVLTWTLTHNVVGPNAAHVHNAPPGENAPPLITLPAASPATGMETLTVAQETELRLGHMYVNVHSPTNPNGEIRGQILLAGSQLWVASLNGKEEVPANLSPAVGYASLIVNAAHTAAHYRVTSNVAMANNAHIHPGIAGVNGAPKFTLTMTGTPAEGDITTFTEADYTTLSQGGYYVNVHSMVDFPMGEIRGQLIQPGEHVYSATLTGVDPAPSLANIQVQFILNAAANSVRYQSKTNVALSGPATSAVVENAAGLDLYMLTPELAGTRAVTAADVVAFNTKLYYVNVLTALKPAGEVRGQIGPVPPAP